MVQQWHGFLYEVMQLASPGVTVIPNGTAMHGVSINVTSMMQNWIIHNLQNISGSTGLPPDMPHINYWIPKDSF